MILPALQVTDLSTPFGNLVILVSPEDGQVRASGFQEQDSLLARLPPTLAQREVQQVSSARLTGTAVNAVHDYCDGKTDALSRVDVSTEGLRGPFLQQVWSTLREIPAGTTVTYAQLADQAGRRGAVRAAGQGCARNLIAPFIPCHRVLRTDGSLGGYAFGVPLKRALLRHEGIAV